MRFTVSTQLRRILETLYCSKFTSSISPASAGLPAGSLQWLPAGGARFFHVLTMGSVGLYWKRSKHSQPLPAKYSEQFGSGELAGGAGPLKYTGPTYR